MIDDIPYLQSFLSQVGIQEVMVIEDTQVLYGDGTGQNLSGLFTNATTFAAGTSVVTAPNQFDVLLAARKQARVAKYNPNIALISPVDFYDMIEKKDTTNNYLFQGGGNGLDVPGVITMRTGLRVVEHTSVASGDFLVFDPSKAAIFDRLGTTVRFYDQDQDNAIKNLITIVIEKRLALPIYQPAAFIKGTFAAAITDLTS
jgi:HK97 family phage major capsid protein